MTSDALSPAPKPFLKWAGGKSQLLPDLLKWVTAAKPFGGYHEPFVGGGALYFALAASRAIDGEAFLSDTNQRLIRTYLGVRNQVEDVIASLRDHSRKHSRDHYYEVRSSTPAKQAEGAARIIYLNRTCFNGLYRENSKGGFNVPMGSYVNPRICDAENLRACSAALKHARIEPRPFETVLDVAKPGDFVYFDPPYVPLSETANFTAYSKGGFGEDSQRRLAEVFATLAKRGVKVLLSNSETPLVRELYGDFRIETVYATRLVNSRADRRGKIAEVLVRSF